MINDAKEQLKTRILAELEKTNGHNGQSKSIYRDLHAPATQFEIRKAQKWIASAFRKYSSYFGSGTDIVPSETNPKLVKVENQWQKDLWRLARFTWSLPYSRGFGRRMRYLVLDQSNGKLIGIIGLQSPPLDFSVRDKRFAYPPGRKVEFVNQTMDVFTLGAIPPYNDLLGGKLVALAVTADEVRCGYEEQYRDALTTIEHRKLPARLVALTTTSAYGRSSIYNRLKYNGRLVAESLGYTKGYGSFHLATLQPEIDEFLRSEGYSTRGGFGVGPRITWQRLTIALQLLGIKADGLKHGVRREAFLFPLISNLEEFMSGVAETPRHFEQPFSDLAAYWKERWCLPRAERSNTWQKWDKSNILNSIL